MDLCNEDKLRLNVLLSQPLQAIRIDESRMQVQALSARGEANIALHANCKAEKYLKLVRQWLSAQVLGSPGGYPVFLRRWTRMGQTRDGSLEKLLLLGEPEAVAAVVHAHGITNEIARRAWWCAPDPENARCLLASRQVAADTMGAELAKFLVEFLPFEVSSRAIMNSVRLVLQPDLINPQTKLAIWKRGKRRNTFYVGFIRQCPDDLPIEHAAHPLFNSFNDVQGSNNIINKLSRVFSRSGQAAVATIIDIVKKPNDQEVAVEIFNSLGEYFKIEGYSSPAWRDMEALKRHVATLIENDHQQLSDCLSRWPHARKHLYALLFLSMISESLLDPVFGVSDAIGSVMRKRIAHLTGPILEQLQALT